jgi:hypothetical protein
MIKRICCTGIWLFALALCSCKPALDADRRLHTPNDEHSRADSYDTGSGFDPHGESQALVTAIDSATLFNCGGMKCQLLGLRESADPSKRVAASEFARKWFRSTNNEVSIANNSHPLVTKKNVNVVWVQGFDGRLGSLNSDLAATGLVDIDDSQYSSYTFSTERKLGPENFDWKHELRRAKEAHAKGIKPIAFEWLKEDAHQ